MKKQTGQRYTSDERLEYYSRVYKSAKFTDWNKFYLFNKDVI